MIFSTVLFFETHRSRPVIQLPEWDRKLAQAAKPGMGIGCCVRCLYHSEARSGFEN